MAKAGTTPPRRESSSPSLGRPLTSGHHLRAWGTVVACYLTIVAILGLNLYFDPYPTQVGMRVPYDIKAPRDFSVVDEADNVRRRQELERNHVRIWELDTQLLSAALQDLNSFVDMVRSADPKDNEQVRQLAGALTSQLGVTLDQNALSRMLPGQLQSMRPALDLQDLQTYLAQVIESVLVERHLVDSKQLYIAHASDGLIRLINADPTRDETYTDHPDSQMVLQWGDDLRSHLRQEALRAYLPREGREWTELREAGTQLLLQLLDRPDLSYNRELSNIEHQKQVQALNETPSLREFLMDDTIVAAGDTLTRLQADALAQLNARRRGRIATQLAGVMLLCAIALGGLVIYLSRFHVGFQFDSSTVLMHALPIILALATAQGIDLRTTDPASVRLWFPAAMVGMLSSLMIAHQVAFVLVLVSTCVFGLVSGQDLSFMVLSLLGGFAAVAASRQVRARAEVMQVGLKVGIVNMIALFIFSLIGGNWFPPPLWLLFGFLNGIFCSLATLILLVICERAFGIVTDLRLLELTGLKHPLISQLEEKAPGSYQHVLNVTKLAEAAATAIGANYLLVRAGALFHDVGKMVKPKYFSENQVTLEDKKAHSRLSPYMSVRIIKNHVKEGVELARRYSLPPKIVDFIPQHHGTGLIRFFYGAALKRYEESPAVEPVREEEFRYPGPKPQSIETAIVLLADSVEAIAASKFTGGQISEDEIRRVAQMAISERFDDGQFEECDLTLRHLRDIREAFVRTLIARYHFRVAYPTLTKPGGSGTQSQQSKDSRSEPTSPSLAVAGAQ